jgi:curli biogenesis system outer membrane secretion channel CsgG
MTGNRLLLARGSAALVLGMSIVAASVSAAPRAAQQKPARAATVAPETVRSFTGPKKRLAVMDLEMKVTNQGTAMSTPMVLSAPMMTTGAVNYAMPPDFGPGLTEMLTTALVNSNRFVLLERKAVQDIQNEVGLGGSGAVRRDSAAEAGNILGAQAMIRGAVTDYTYRKSNVGVSSGAILGRNLGVQRSTTEAHVAIDLRLYDASTGQILDSTTAEGRAKAGGNAVSVATQSAGMDTSSFASTPLGQACREAIQQAVKFICDRMERVRWEGAIAEIDAENDQISALYLNAGRRTGIKVGDEFDIFRAGRPIVNPETKVVIGRTRDTALGRCKVESVDPDVAIATPTGGSGFRKGDLIRFIDGRQ